VSSNEEELARLRERLAAAQNMAVELGLLAKQLENETRVAIERIDRWRALWKGPTTEDQEGLFQQTDV
jgi:hypothetical protein